MATRHPLLPTPLQPRPIIFPPPDPSSKAERFPPPAARDSFKTLGLVPEMITKPHSTSRHGLAPPTNLTLVQHNSLSCWDVFLYLFSSLAEGPPTHIVLLQDPPSSKGFLPSFSRFKFFAPHVAKPRVACYASLRFLQKFAVLPFFPQETDDFMVLDVFTPKGCFSTNFPRFRIGNSYAIPLSPHPHAVSPKSSLQVLDYPYLVTGDFNIHNAASDPSRLLSAKEQNESPPYFDRATDLGFTLHNTPGVYTRFPFTGPHRPSAIDLAFANPHMFPAFRYWDASSLPSTGSDHAPIIISLRPPAPHNDKPRPHWQDADWPALTDILKNWQIPPPPNTPSPSQLDHWFSSALSDPTTTIEDSTPHSRPSPRSRAWWTPLLTALRKEFTKATRRAKKLQTPASYTTARQSKLRYFKAIKTAKASYWADFLAKSLSEQHLGGQTIGRAKKDPQISHSTRYLRPSNSQRRTLEPLLPPQRTSA